MSKEEIEEIGRYLNTKYIIARNVDNTDKLSSVADNYIQKLYDSYLDLKIKFNEKSSQLDIANKKLEEIKEHIEKIIKKISIQIRDYKNIFNRLENIHYSHVERELEAIEYKIQIGLDSISKLKESDKGEN